MVSDSFGNVSTFIIIFLIALAITLVSTPWMRRTAFAVGFVDAPNERKVHASPIPLMGGIAIFAGAMLATLLVFREQLPRQITGAVAAGSLVALVGLIDDRYHIPPWLRIGAQIAAVAILVRFGIRVSLPIPAAANYAITLLWVLGITNGLNLIDNMDGLSTGVAAVAASFFMLIGSMNDQYLVATVAAAILGACVGFLRYNFPPAQIFMGDAGAYFLGFWLAVLGIQLRFPQNVDFVTWMVPVMIVGLPILDTSLVVISRVRRGVHPFTAGKDHLSHRLVARNFSPREAVLALYLAAGMFGMVGLFLTQAEVVEGYFIGAVVSLLSLYVIWRLDRQKVGADLRPGDSITQRILQEDRDRQVDE